MIFKIHTKRILYFTSNSVKKNQQINAPLPNDNIKISEAEPQDKQQTHDMYSADG